MLSPFEQNTTIGEPEDVSQVDSGAVRCLNSRRGEVIADEQLVDNELDFFRV